MLKRFENSVNVLHVNGHFGIAVPQTLFEFLEGVDGRWWHAGGRHLLRDLLSQLERRRRVGALYESVDDLQTTKRGLIRHMSFGERTPRIAKIGQAGVDLSFRDQHATGAALG